MDEKTDLLDLPEELHQFSEYWCEEFRAKQITNWHRIEILME